MVTQGTETLKGAHSAFMVNRRFAALDTLPYLTPIEGLQRACNARVIG